MINNAIIFTLLICVSCHDIYDENSDWIGSMTANKIAQDQNRNMEFVHSLNTRGEIGYGSTITYDMEIVVSDAGVLKLCDAKLLANVFLNSYELLYYDCRKQDFYERDDMPDEQVAEEDKRTYADCDGAEQQELSNVVIGLLNDRIDDDNSELDFDDPMMMEGMEDLKQQHYDEEPLDVKSCKVSRGSDTIFKADITALQGGITQRCSIELHKDEDVTELINSQCQGQS